MADLLEWASRAGAGSTVELVCHDAESLVAPGSDGATVVRLRSCVGEAPLALPYELVARGVRHVVVRLDACPVLEAGAVDRWARLFAAHAPDRVSVRSQAPEPTALVEPVPADRMPRLTRRGLLAMLTTPGSDAEPPRPVGTAHQRLRQAVGAVLGAGGTPSAEAGELVGIGLLLEASDCDLTGVCVRTCPEQALGIERTGQRARLVLEPGACSGCGSCLEACTTQALRRVGSATWSSLTSPDRVTVAEVTSRTCERCRASFGGRGTAALCPTCAFRRANPFASVLPDEVRRRLADGNPGGVSL